MFLHPPPSRNHPSSLSIHPVKSRQSASVGIIGAAGYIGETLVQLLARHPFAEISVVTSRRTEGESLKHRLPRLRGAVDHLSFSNPTPAEIAARDDLDACFLALPHGTAAEWAIGLAGSGIRVIDLSADFRLDDAETYRTYYGSEHPAPDMLATTPYVIPEIAPGGWERASLIACPGCYPTSIQIPLVPLLREQLIEPAGIVINSLSGVSGAGKKATEFYSFCERDESAVAYGAPLHRHLAEIEEQLGRAAETTVVVQFTPHLIPLRRGILSTIVAKPGNGADLDAIYRCWNDWYGDEPFVQLLDSGQFPDTGHVAGTNRVDISAVHDARTGNFVITAALDNLVKGAAGQAIQIFNTLFGFPPASGLT